MMGEIGPGGGMPGMGRPKPARSDDTEEKDGGAGFTILIEGYSPYRNIAELLDPPSVRDDQTRWGFVTRLDNLAKLFPDVPFELFHKYDIKHFNVKTGWVDLEDKDMPPGIGVQKEIERVPEPVTPRGRGAGGARMGMRRMQDFVPVEDVLIDPMTNEEISKTFDIITQQDIDRDPELTEKDLGRKKINRLTGDPLFIERDQWFRIKAKFTWKDAPKQEAPAGDPMGMF